MRVFLRGTEGVCSESAPGQYSQPRDFVIRPKDSVTVKYNVVPLKIGEFPLEIFVVSARGNDAVRRILKVLVSLIFSFVYNNYGPFKSKFYEVRVSVSDSKSNRMMNNIFAENINKRIKIVINSGC